MIPMNYLNIIQPEDLLIILVSVIMSFIGSLSKDYINLMRKGDKMDIGRITMSTISASILTYTFSIYILNHFSFRGLVGIAYFCGLLGFELVSKISNLNSVIQILKLLALDSEKLKKLEENLAALDDEAETKEKEEEKNNDEIKKQK